MLLDDCRLILDDKSILLNDIAIISFKAMGDSTYCVEVAFNGDKDVLRLEHNMDIKSMKYALQYLNSKLCTNGTNSFYNMGSSLINLGNIESITCTKARERGKDHIIMVNFTQRAYSFKTNKSIAKRAIKAFNDRYAQYAETADLQQK